MASRLRFDFSHALWQDRRAMPRASSALSHGWQPPAMPEKALYGACALAGELGAVARDDLLELLGRQVELGEMPAAERAGEPAVEPEEHGRPPAVVRKPDDAVAIDRGKTEVRRGVSDVGGGCSGDHEPCSGLPASVSIRGHATMSGP